MGWFEDTVWCDGCGVEIACVPVAAHGGLYCCQDCAAGRPCHCESLLELEDDRRTESPAGTDYGGLPL